MRVKKHRYKYRVIAFLMALLMTVPDTGMIALAKTEAVEDIAVQNEEIEGIGENGTGDEETDEKTGNKSEPQNGNENEETDPADDETGDEETDPADGETGDEETDPADGETGDEETDPADDETGNEETDPADDETGDEETDPADGETGDEETDPADGKTGDEETDPADDEIGDEEIDPIEGDEAIAEDGQLEIDVLTMDIPGNNLMQNDAAVSLGTPQNLVLDNGSIDTRLSWDMVSDATAEYEIQFAIDENLSPDKLTDNDFKTFITVDPDQAVEESTDGSMMWPPYVTVAGNRMTYTFRIETLPVDPENPDSVGNYFPVLSQYAVYRVRAVVMDETAETGETAESGGTTADPTYGEFSNYASANGMFNYNKKEINEERRERFNMPGSSDYERFFLGDAEGTEYNESNPIILHEGESIDNLTLWAVCADGTKVNYTQMRDAIIKAEQADWGGVAELYKEVGDSGYYYNFTWAIDEQLADRDNIYYCCDEFCYDEHRHIRPFYKYLGNTVADCLGFKALAKTNGTAYLGVSLNSIHSIDMYEVCVSFRFFVPIRILDAEQGVNYPELDAESVICETSEEFWAAARQKIRDRKENFVVLMTEQACKAFCDENGYEYTIQNEGLSSEYLLLDLEDKDREYIIDRWLFTQYEEQEGMEPWAGDNLMIAFKKDSLSFVNNLRLNGQRYHGITFSAQYRTTLEQEQELDARIAALLGEGGELHDAYVSGSQFKKIQAAYNYTRGITWVDGRLDPLNYTVYSGVIRRKGSCESSSETFVRLCHEMGVNARVVKDDYWLVGGNNAHAWNIVECNGLWYYVDCTSGIFMKGSSTFGSRQQLALYRSKEFKDSHPISKYDYVMRKVTYNLNGGTNAAMNPDSFEPGDVLTIAPPTKTGYTFEGWYADRALKTRVIGSEDGTYDTASLAGNLTLYAKWSANEYTLSYDINIPDNATVKTQAAINDVSVKYNSAVKIAVNKCTLYKYAFTGWNTEADGTGKAYKAGASVKNLASENGGEYKLYAQWAPTTYTVKYDGNGSSVGLSVKGKTASTTMKFYEETNTTKANGFTISGYKFAGWNTRADGRGLKLGTEAGEDGKVSGSDVIGTKLETVYARDTKATVTLYAQWEAIPYTVKLHRNDGTDGEVQIVTMDIGKALSSKSAANLTRNGYKLSSWNTQPNGKGKKYALTAKNLAKPEETIDLYAQWGKPLSYKVTYDLQGGRNPSRGKKNPTQYTVASTEDQRTLVAPTKTGYSFVKWVDASAEDPENADEIKVIPVDVCRNIKLRAVWKENSYKVIYHGANEKYSSVTDDIERIYRYTELADAFDVAKQYTLKDNFENKVSISAWTTKANGKGKSYAVGKGFSKLSAFNYNEDDESDDKGTVHLYAKWSTAVYRISYVNCSKANGVKNSNAVSYTYNASKTVSIKKPSRTGYVFAGWSVPDGKDYFDQAKNRIKAGTAEDVELTANWTPITYEVKLKLNNKDKGISFKTPDVKTVYGSRDGNGIAYNTEADSFDTRNIVNIPEYYELVGWNTKTNGKGIAAKCKTDAETGEITSVNLAGLCTRNKGTVTLYAIWKPKTYSITYRNMDPDSTGESISELDGVKVSNPATYTYSASKTVKLKNPTKYGFVFMGWYRNYDPATGDYKDKVTSIQKGSHEDITLYGKWRVK